jgi:predicted MPP superfamily phosphohydrolase
MVFYRVDSAFCRAPNHVIVARSQRSKGDGLAVNDPIRIAHLSDLHFGLKGQDETWNLLKDHLKNQVHPDLIVITGDLADNPQRKPFEKAQGAVEDLCRRTNNTLTPCFVCPGNHDRFWHGNRLWKLNPFRRIWPPKPFEFYFEKLGPTLTKPADITLGTPANQWHLRILAIDSSLEADRFARGKIPLQVVQDIAQTMLSSDKVDLGLMLVHHHVLSVRALEHSSQDNPLRLLNVTSLTNSGSLLEALACAHVDVVLHGHEHAANWGRYATLTGGGGATTVIAAGSSTGVADSVRCEQNKASYNLIELWPNRSVTMKVRGWNAQWYDVGGSYLLFEPEDVRRSRALRRSGTILERPASSEIVKSVRFTPDGDGQVQESRTDWQIENNKWTLLISNDTGVPGNLSVSFTKPNGNEYELRDQPFQELKRTNPDDPRQFYFECRIDDADEPLRVRLAYTWSGGAVLTAQEMDIVKTSAAAGPFRKQGYEFAAATAVSSLKSLRLVVEVPPERAPKDSHVLAFQQDAGGDPALFSAPPDLANCLRIIRTGLYSLTVPYPLKNYRYAIAWKPTPSALSERARRFAAAVRAGGSNLAQLFHQSAAPTLGGNLVTSIYLPNKDRLSRLELVRTSPDGVAGRPSPVDLHESCQIMSQAWRGNISTSGIVPADRRASECPVLGMTPDEIALIAAPVRFGENEEFAPPWCVIRIGVLKASPETERLLDLTNLAPLQQVLEGAILKALLAFGLPD